MRPPIRPSRGRISRLAQPRTAASGSRPAIRVPRTAQTATAHATIGSGPSADAHQLKDLIRANAPRNATDNCNGVYGPKGSCHSPIRPNTVGWRRAAV
ncbi:hypothetical protein ACIO3O_37905 [Streptomyces sp. NPDC087440]|uniref:hypothetical protein n=1 Tax=Streptomyces sp. NPDC087440 TaxID=3365790 RepID=UPI0038122551